MYNFPVELQDAYTPTGRLITKKKAVVRTDTGEPLAIVSDRYSLITHEDVINPLKNIFKDVGDYKERVDLDKSGAVLHYTAEFVDRKLALSVGDVCGLRVYVKNTYDGMGCTSLRVGSVVLSCTNGMVRDSSKFNNIRIRHIGDGKNRLQFPNTSDILEEFNHAAAFWNSLNSCKVDAPIYEKVLKELSEEKVLATKLYDQWREKNHPENAWNFLQDVTYNVTHERERMTYGTKLNTLAKANSIFERNFIQ